MSLVYILLRLLWSFKMFLISVEFAEIAFITELKPKTFKKVPTAAMSDLRPFKGNTLAKNRRISFYKHSAKFLTNKKLEM